MNLCSDIVTLRTEFCLLFGYSLSFGVCSSIVGVILEPVIDLVARLVQTVANLELVTFGCFVGNIVKWL